ncbi:MAG TPA: hypothetical protein VH684_18880 [Xanthobacteraceae bacterium]
MLWSKLKSRHMKSRHMRGGAQASVLALIVVTAFTHTSARAQDDDDYKNSIWNIDKRFFEAVAKGIGLVKGGDPSVDYRERSPLVVPPTRDLPPPQSAPKRTAEWPVDPDATRRESAASRKKLDQRGYDEDYQNRSLMPGELDSPAVRQAREKQQASNKPRTAGDEKVDMSDGEGSNLTPSQLGFTGFSWSSLGFGSKEEYGTFKKEPPRRSLTEPPVGYQTPSPDQPYGIGKDKQRRTATPLDPAVGSLE